MVKQRTYSRSLRLFCYLLLPMYSNAPVSLVEDGIVTPYWPAQPVGDLCRLFLQYEHGTIGQPLHGLTT